MTASPGEVSSLGVVVLCGGTSRRLGVADKTAQRVGGVPMLDRVLGALPPGCRIVCVGDPRPSTRDVAWAREEPAGSGPLAGIAAGVAALGPDIAVVAVVAGDQPFAGPAVGPLVTALTATPDVDAVAARQGDGRAQLLLAAYRAEALRRELVGEVRDAGVHRRLRHLRVSTLDVTSEAVFDVDTAEDLSRARRHADTFEA